MKLGPLDALTGQVELAEVEKLKLDPQHRSGKIKIALARFSYYEPIGKYAAPDPHWPQVPYRGATRVQRRALLVAGYYNGASKFDEHVADFDRALAQLSFEPESAAPLAPLPTPAPASSPAGPVNPNMLSP